MTYTLCHFFDFIFFYLHKYSFLHYIYLTPIITLLALIKHDMLINYHKL